MDKKEDVIEFSDNDLGIKYATLYDEHANISSNHKRFDARIDDADHTAFYCDKCQRETRIVELTLSKRSKDMHNLKNTHTLHFELYCETCGGTETKKMYLNSPIGEVNWQ
jgi:hypothetical protein